MKAQQKGWRLDMNGKLQSGSTPGALAGWRMQGIGLLRVVFGLVWAIDAWFKWQPDFVNNFMSYLMGAQDGQPQAVRSWIHFWHVIIGVDPRTFAYLTAAGETAVAVALILGVFSNLTAV